MLALKNNSDRDNRLFSMGWFDNAHEEELDIIEFSRSLKELYEVRMLDEDDLRELIGILIGTFIEKGLEGSIEIFFSRK